MGREIKVDESAASSPMRFAMTKAIEGGTSGAMAMAIQVTNTHKRTGNYTAACNLSSLQVTSLMWMRTTMNYQYRYGTTTTQAMRKLYAEGGVLRFYRGITPALFQAREMLLE